jgi:TolB-like protein
MDVLERVRHALAERYTIERELGRGGMGVVLRVVDRRHGRPVALKLVGSGPTGANAIERFQREVRLAARLQHPHILTVLDSGTIPAAGDEPAIHWYTMPLVDGGSLRERLRAEGHLPLADAVRITVEAARALQHAHQAGVIHRDVKPENLLLAKDGTTLVADFGLARLVGGEDRVTREGVVLGTVDYMSPEQAQGKAGLDGRSDQYALASVLFEMLAGEPPFTGSTPRTIITKRLASPAPSIRFLRPTVPEGVDRVLRRALAPSLGDRFPSMTAFAEALQQEAVSAETTRGVPGAGRWMSASFGALGERPWGVPAIALLVGLVLGVGGLITWLRLADASPPGSGRVVAVLPFENLGDSADAYFADGVSDEVRTKLAQVAGLEVIARGSSLEYRGTRKRPAEIARELGADYLLTGTIRWDTVAGERRVRVTPELVEVRGGRSARSRWGRRFDAALTDVFQVQADIATRVSEEIGVALADSARLALAHAPTANLAAYDEFLKGEAAAHGMKSDPVNLRRAVAFYERAVGLDSAFPEAWAQLSRARSSLYSQGFPSPALRDEAWAALEHARGLAPEHVLVHLAAGDFYGGITPIDNARALQAYETGLRTAPGNVDLLGAAVSAETGLGRWDGVVERLRRVAALDPRSANTARRLATVLTFLRHHPAADSAADRALALAPTNPFMVLEKVQVTLARGDLDSARAVLRAAATRIDTAILYPYFAMYQDLYWVLDDAQQQAVLAAPLGAFGDDPSLRAIVRAEILHLRGDLAGARAWADSARVSLHKQGAASSDDGQQRALLGLAYAYLGKKSEAIREGRRGVRLLPTSQDAYTGPYLELQLARIYLLAGEREQALDRIEALLRTPFYLSPGWLRVDPTFDPVREHPRFRALIAAEAGTP